MTTAIRQLYTLLCNGGASILIIISLVIGQKLLLWPVLGFREDSLLILIVLRFEERVYGIIYLVYWVVCYLQPTALKSYRIILSDV